MATLNENNDNRTYYNKTLWDSDAPHLARSITNMSLGSGLFLFYMVISLLLLIRLRKFPLKAHGPLVQFQKIFGNAYVSLYFTIFMLLNRFWIGLFVIFLPFATLFPTMQRCWIIYFTLNESLMKLKASSDGSEIQDEQKVKEIKWARFWISKKFNVTAGILLFVLHVLMIIPAIPLSLAIPNSNHSFALFYSIVVAVIIAIFYGIVTLVMFVKLIRLEFSENFHIFKAIVVNLILITFTIFFVSYYTAALVASAFLYDYNAGFIIYWTFLPIDVILHGLLFIDVFVANIIPLTHTFFWKSDNVDVDSSEELFDIFKDKEMLERFRQFAASEWSVENLVFYEHVEKTNARNLTGDELLETFKKLYLDYICDSAHLQLNIDGKVLLLWKKAIDSRVVNDSKEALEKAISSTLANMQDTLARFRLNAFYEDWHKKTIARRKTMIQLGWTETKQPDSAALDKQRSMSRIATATQSEIDKQRSMSRINNSAPQPTTPTAAPVVAQDTITTATTITTTAE